MDTITATREYDIYKYLRIQHYTTKSKADMKNVDAEHHSHSLVTWRSRIEHCIIAYQGSTDCSQMWRASSYSSTKRSSYKTLRLGS